MWIGKGKKENKESYARTKKYLLDQHTLPTQWQKKMIGRHWVDAPPAIWDTKQRKTGNRIRG